MAGQTNRHIPATDMIDFFDTNCFLEQGIIQGPTLKYSFRIFNSEFGNIISYLSFFDCNLNTRCSECPINPMTSAVFSGYTTILMLHCTPITGFMPCSIAARSRPAL